jgi:hypothetical protein
LCKPLHFAILFGSAFYLLSTLALASVKAISSRINSANRQKIAESPDIELGSLRQVDFL